MHRLWARARTLWKGLWRSGELDADMHEEMRFHLEMETERLIREHHLDSTEARRRAHVAFGGIEKYKEVGRDTRGLRWLDAVWLDCRFGLRMLAKYRGLTFVGGFAMAIAMAIGATAFEAVTALLDSSLPFPGGDRVVAVHYVASNPGDPERRVLREFAALRGRLRSVDGLGAFVNEQHTLVSGTAPPEPVRVAEMTAAGFTIAQTPALLGRVLLPSDEDPGAIPVVVVGFSAWRSRFNGDPAIVGRDVVLGGISRAVVGVMPEGFRFPVDHEFWIPFQQKRFSDEPLAGPPLYLFGRLQKGVSLRQAQAEVDLVAAPVASVDPVSRERLRPVVLPYTREHVDLSHPALVWLLRVAQLLIGALSVVVAVNLAILVYARTVTRLGELAVRAAFGASRRRIVAQLFTEALGLSLLGAASGLVLAHVALDALAGLADRNGSVPFWIQFDLSRATIIYAFALAIVAAVIMGVVPGLRATRSGLDANLHELNARNGTRLGTMWTTLVVTQVAAAVAVLPAAVYMSWRVVQLEIKGPGFAAEEFIVATAALGGPQTPDALRVRTRQLELMSRVAEEPGVAAVTFSSSVPGFAGSRRIVFDDAVASPPAGTMWPSTMSVGVDMLDIYGAVFVAGRNFTGADLGTTNAVVVNETFVKAFQVPPSPLGLRFRYLGPSQHRTDTPHEWHEIVGVIRDLPAFPSGISADGEPTVYHPATAGDLHPVVVSTRFAGSLPAGFVDRFKTIGAEVDPALQLRRVMPLTQFYDDVRSFWRYLAWTIALVTAAVLLLSAAGIYALMSFTVAQRTREIGIRTALGAQPRWLMMSVFGRATAQLAVGSVVGSVLAGAVFVGAGIALTQVAVVLLTVVALMLVVGALAACGPARRGLRIEVLEALRSDA